MPGHVDLCILPIAFWGEMWYYTSCQGDVRASQAGSSPMWVRGPDPQGETKSFTLTKNLKEVKIMTYEYWEVHEEEFLAAQELEEWLLMEADYEASNGHLWD